jgi:TonB family protein
MTTTVRQLGQGSLRIGWGFAEPPRGKGAPKNLVAPGGKPARFTLLADPKPRWGSFGASVVLQCLAWALLVIVPMLFPQKLVPIMRYTVVPLLTQRTEVPLPPEPPKPPKMRVKPEPPKPVQVEPPRVAKLMAPPPRPKAPKPKPVEAIAPELKPVFQAVRVDAPKSEPRRPREDVKTGLISAGSAAPATVNRPLNQVQTGGFGDPNGLPGKGDPNKRGNIAQKGSYDLPSGPGYGNGTGGANGVRGTVASTGFGNGIAVPPSGKGGSRGTVRQGGFSDAAAPAEAPKPRQAASTSPTQPIEIIAKPNPVYTQEARGLKIEGDVLVEVVFTASGVVRVGRVVRGLGHGLDEAAVRAAQQIRFKPARRDGQPVDFPAVVHIVFQLAY